MMSEGNNFKKFQNSDTKHIFSRVAHIKTL